MADISTFQALDLPPISKIKFDLVRATRECSQRKLLNSAKWAAEMSYGLEVQLEPSQLRHQDRDDFLKEYDQYTLAVSYFDLKEYDRAAHFVHDCHSSQAYFLYMYSRYLAEEKRKNDNASDSIGPPNKLENEQLKTLKMELCKKYANKELDGFCLYLYGVVLKKLELIKESMEIFVEAIAQEPLHWGAWQELAGLITDKETLLSLYLPNHWIKNVFLAHIYLQLQLNEEAMKIYQSLAENGFAKSSYIVSQIAVAYHNMRDVDQAMTVFTELQEMDPYRLENMDIFSNLLYIKEMRAELANLAHKCCDIDKYRVETCCVIGNYYSIRQQHEKAVLYFQRALKLNPHYLSAWTLMGHEFMELKNTSAALQAYRQAIEVERRDYRAWYGLGQTYEILKMHYYCLYYYRQAQKLRPNDSRMVMALGETYEKLERLQEAKKCFWKANCIGDMEGTALIKLARLHEKLHEEDQAASAYTDYINEASRQGNYNPEDQSQAYKYLANYHLKLGQLDEAFTAAQKCSEFPETREEAKGILRDIQSLRAQKEGLSTPMRMDDSMGSITTERFHTNDHTPIGRLSPVNLKFTP
ncbi:cell division cycle protein 23 homolog [Pecten maximus]|uniref:cell division cycle protein 23 homolog n=1 Tax=Pecten maximus TaxID=6579 RepID=UPI001458703C|nr:cell division cycle protein 23 homolog [Pecten maximus]